MDHRQQIVEGEPGIFPPGIPKTPIDAVRAMVRWLRRRLDRRS